EHKRYDNDIRVATNPFDFAIASFQNYMSLRDVYAARASEEVSRELVLRIPLVKSFIEDEEQRIRDRIKTKLKYLPTSHPGMVIENESNPAAVPSIQNEKQIVE
ncbi:MAG: hypothetical protein V3V70_06560, partial [Candidatus Scalindua sp.]